MKIGYGTYIAGDKLATCYYLYEARTLSHNITFEPKIAKSDLEKSMNVSCALPTLETLAWCYVRVNN